MHTKDHGKLEKISDKKNKKPIFKNELNLPNFFENSGKYIFLNTYDFNSAIQRLENLSEDYIINDLDHTSSKNFEFTLKSENSESLIENIYIATDKKVSDETLNLINLVNLREYVVEQGKFEINPSKNPDKNEILIKMNVDRNKISQNVLKNFVKNSNFESTKELLILSEFKKPEFMIIIENSSIKNIYESGEQDIVLELLHPPNYKSNFLLQGEREHFEYSIFPFRNFINELSNLKYRSYYLYFKINKNNTTNNNNIFNNKKNILKQIFSSKKNFIKKEINIINEDDLRKEINIKRNEINNYFEGEFRQILIKLGFEDKDLPVFLYLMLVLISENILTYFNAIEFMNNFKNFYKNLNDFNNSVFIETLKDIINLKKNVGIQFSLEQFEEEIKTNSVKNEKRKNIAKDKIKNKFLVQSQRIIVTPSYTKFVPYIEDQGNRILRDYLEDPNDAVRLVFKMDNFEEARWNNKYLLEYIKYYLDTGISLANKSYKFFCYSQSQFRSMSCWLVVNPEFILKKSGQFEKINIVSKYGARIGQTLTTTIRTLQIPNNSIIEVDDVDIKYIDTKDNQIIQRSYTFSDGVGTISYDFAERIAKILELEEVPSAYQARFLGCKGVWTVLYDNLDSEIRIRPSQKKFKAELTDEQYFEVCNISKFIKSYLNRQVILLLSAIGIPNEVFIRKLENYKKNFEDEKFILSLINYEEWGSIFMKMYFSGINRFNDRLIRSIISSNRKILYRELENKARIFIEEGVNAMGIMDEYGILEYGEAFLRICNDNMDFILDKPCAVVKCPCLHPGDVRLLKFKNIEKFRNYKNVIIFPKKGKRPHPNEISGGDLDGDLYYIFWDEDLCKINPVEPMDYTDNSKPNEKKNIGLKDVIEFFAEYINTNNLGLIADAHLAHADLNSANDPIAVNLAVKFSQAVDAPKTGAKVTLNDNENPKKISSLYGKEE